MELLAPLLQRKVIIALALVGAAIALAGSFLLKRGGVDPRLARFVLRFGYGVTWASVALFIAAGFLGS